MGSVSASWLRAQTLSRPVVVHSQPLLAVPARLCVAKSAFGCPAAAHHVVASIGGRWPRCMRANYPSGADGTTYLAAAASVSRQQAVLPRVGGREPSAGHAELGVDVGNVAFDGADAQYQLLGDLAVGVMAGHEREHLTFSKR